MSVVDWLCYYADGGYLYIMLAERGLSVVVEQRLKCGLTLSKGVKCCTSNRVEVNREVSPFPRESS